MSFTITPPNQSTNFVGGAVTQNREFNEIREVRERTITANDNE